MLARYAGNGDDMLTTRTSGGKRSAATLVAAVLAVVLIASGCSGDDDADTATTEATVDTADRTTLVDELERICAAGGELDDLEAVITMATAELEALEVDGPDGEVVARLIEEFDQAQQAVDAGNSAAADGLVARASAIVRDAGGECDGPPTSDADLVEPDAVIDIGGSTGQITAVGDDVWVSDFDGNVIRVHGPTSEIVARIPVDDQELRTIQVASSGVWVRGASALHRIDPSTNEITTSVPKSQLGADITRAFVDDAAIWACSGTNLVRATLEGQPTATVDLGFRCGTVTSSDGQVWVASDAGGPGRWARIDPTSAEVALTVDVPVDFATFPAIDNGQVWSHGQGDAADPGFVAVDAETGEVLHQGSLDAGGGPGALSPTMYFAVSSDSHTVLGIDRTTGEILSRLDGGLSPNAAALSGGSLWVVDDAGGQLLRFDL